MKHLFIVNPTSGGKHSHAAQTKQKILSFMSGTALDYEIYVTKAPMDACYKIRQEAGTQTPLRVYACGGDGTLNECVNGAAGFSHVAVTHYPCGTGNDFVKMFGTEDARRFHNLQALVEGFLHPIDLINCNGRYGVNICSVGIDARIGTDVHKYSRIPLIGGATGYVVSMFVNLVRGVNQKLKITTETQHLEGRFALICACNGRFYGGGFNPVPQALPDDGMIEFLIVNEVSRLKFISVVGKYAKGRYKEVSEIISHVRGHNMTIESEKELVVNVDGELLSASKVTFQMIHHGVNFIFPTEMNFFKSNDAQCGVI